MDYKLSPKHRDEVNALIEQAQDDLEGVLFRLVGQREELRDALATSVPGGDMRAMQVALAQEKDDKIDALRSMLLKTTGCLGLLIGGAGRDCPAYKETYAGAKALLANSEMSHGSAAKTK